MLISFILLNKQKFLINKLNLSLVGASATVLKSKLQKNLITSTFRETNLILY